MTARDVIVKAMYEAMAGDLPSTDLEVVADTVLRALDEAVLAVVPKIATREMALAGRNRPDDVDPADIYQSIYRAMVEFANEAKL